MRRLMSAGAALVALSTGFAVTPASAAAPGDDSSARSVAMMKAEQVNATRDFGRLSKDGQKAFANILLAQQALTNNQNGQAQSLINDAEARLDKAAKDSKAFIKAEDAMQPVPSHGMPKRVAASGVPLHWLPVGGEYAVTDTLAPAQQTALANANQHLKAGDTKLVNQDLQVVGTSVQYVVALAPLEMISGDVHRASVFMDGGDTKSAADALQNAVDSILFVSGDVVAVTHPSAAKRHKMAHSPS
ncbi:YfdX family protein [Asaia sp. As-1742]|uniref:YfdX family protein n=1 Tax=Asaia sp. As-1742 TaxID=2608325 RepID=UPI0014241806|nr:YfdX family protein [Asaia sp. As-1742]NIE79278.1 YfdX family protein [Asaia sp. As-1742]